MAEQAPFGQLTKDKMRNYQWDVVNHVRGSNHIVVMDTGTGKTLIAAQLAFEMLKQKPSKKVIFLAPSVPLVDQQSKTLSGQCSKRYNVCAGVGGKKFSNCFYLRGVYDIAVCTPGYFHNYLKSTSPQQKMQNLLNKAGNSTYEENDSENYDFPSTFAQKPKKSTTQTIKHGYFGDIIVQEDEDEEWEEEPIKNAEIDDFDEELAAFSEIKPKQASKPGNPPPKPSSPSYFKPTNTNGFYFDDISMIIFDECHHIRKDHPYHQIIEELNEFNDNCSPDKRPIILGLTASLSHAKTESEIYRDIHALTNFTRCKIYSPSQQQIEKEFKKTKKTKNLVSKINVVDEMPKYDESSISQVQNKHDFFMFLEDKKGTPFMKDLYKWIKYFEKVLKSKYILDFVSPFAESCYLGSSTKTSEIIKNLNKIVKDFIDFRIKSTKGKEIMRNVRNLQVILTFLYQALQILFVSVTVPYKYDDISFFFLNHVFRSENLVFGKGQESMKINMQQILQEEAFQLDFLDKWEDYFFISTKNDEKLQKSRTPLLFALKNRLLEEYETRKEEFQGILFVQQKVTSQALELFINNDEDLRIHFSTAAICGNSDMAKTHRQQRIEKFRAKELNLLISTSVAEEGLDIPNCNVVIRFDPVQSAVSFIQSQGRARADAASFVTMKDTGTTIEEFAKAPVIQREVIKKINEKSEGFNENDNILQNNWLGIDLTADKDRFSQLNEIIQRFSNIFPRMKLEEGYLNISQLPMRWCCTLVLNNIGLDGESLAGDGEGNSKKEAKKEAAWKLLMLIVNSKEIFGYK